MPGPRMILFATLAACIWAAHLPAQTNLPATTNLPPPRPGTSAPPAKVVVPVKPAPNAPPSFRLKPGFRMEVAAAAPDVVSPAAMAFDELGRLFVAEMPDFPRRDPEGLRGRVRLLEDRDGDGKFEISSIFADDLSWPSAIACYDGGVFVAVTPEIVYLKDTLGTGVADMRRVVFTGFGPTNPAPDRLLGHFKWGPDNRFHGLTAGLRGMVTSPASLQPVNVGIGDADFSFDPRTLDLSPEAGPAGAGLNFDSAGRKFVSDSDRPLRLAAYEPRYYARNPFVPRPPQFLEVVSPATAIWRYVSGKPLTPSPAPGVVATDLSPGWLSSVRGTLIYQGVAFPSNYLGNVFIPDVEARVVHRAIIRYQGIYATAERAPEDRATEFLVAEDLRFQPSQLVCGPDDSLYLADFNGGGESGRIFRIAPTNYVRPKFPSLGRLNPGELVAALGATGEWRRDSARRLLCERRDPASLSALTNMVQFSRDPRSRLQALQSLAGMEALNLSHVSRALNDADESVRVRALLLLEPFLRSQAIPADLVNQLRRLTADPSPRVRYQLAFTIAEGTGAAAAPFLTEMLFRDINNPLFRSALLSSMAFCSTEVFALLCANMQFRASDPGGDFIRELAMMIGASGRQELVSPAIGTGVAMLTDPAASFATLAALNEGLRRTRSSLFLADPTRMAQPAENAAFNLAIDETTIWPVRIQAVKMLGTGAFFYPDVADWVLPLLANSDSDAMEQACISTMGHLLDPRVPNDLVQRWGNLMPNSRVIAAQMLARRADRAGVLMDALRAGRVSRADIPEPLANFLRSHHDLTVQQRALALFGPVQVQRPRAVAQFSKALALPGSPARGRELFVARCAACHRLGDAGQRVGPDLSHVKMRTGERLLSDLLEPNGVIAPGFATSVVHTQEGESFFGIMTDDGGVTIALRYPGGTHAVWPVANIQAVENRNWSLMPVGLESGLSLQAMADLLSFLRVSP